MTNRAIPRGRCLTSNRWYQNYLYMWFDVLPPYPSPQNCCSSFSFSLYVFLSIVSCAFICMYVSSTLFSFQNPREASSQTRIILISLVYVCMYVFIYGCIYVCDASWPNEKRYRPEIWHTYSYWPYLKTGFLFFRSNPRDGR